MLQLLCLIFPSPNSHPHHKATLRFILKYPRRVYTNLFPSAPTWWLLFMLVCLNGIDWVSFELLNINNPATEAIPKGYRALDGLFQALAVRSGGFYVISITSLRIGLQFLYVIMMYISVYPVVITMRHSNVYEERSLGIYAEDVDSSSSDEDGVDDDDNDDENTPARRPRRRATDTDNLPRRGNLAGKLKRTLTVTMNNLSAPFVNPVVPRPSKHSANSGSQFVRQQIRGQLAHDLWWLVGAILIITCIEGAKFNSDPVTFAVFNIIFEVVSAYGCVGISTGLPNQAYSFSGAWTTSSKLVLCAVMLRGRHRGLPVALDRAVRLPREREWGVDGVEERERSLRRARSWSLGEAGGRVGN
jgi:Trk-type K+ transport system membrane component